MSPELDTERLSLRPIGIGDEPNGESIRVLEKLGMGEVNRAVVNGRLLLYYEVRM